MTFHALDAVTQDAGPETGRPFAVELSLENVSNSPTVLVHVFVVSWNEALTVAFEHHGSSALVRLMRTNVTRLLIV